MPLIADLIDQAAAERLAAIKTQPSQRQADAPAVPAARPVCESCGQQVMENASPRPGHGKRHGETLRAVPAAVFLSGAEHPGRGAGTDPSRARA